MIAVRPAKPADAPDIAAVHVAAWRSAYAGILPEAYLAGLSVPRQAAYYQAGLVAGHAALVAETEREIVGFATVGRRRQGNGKGAIAEGEIETLYVLDDFREQGAGRKLLHAAAESLARAGCRSLFLWVLRENPSRWFYQHLQGRRAVDGQTWVAGVSVPKTAYVWDPIDTLLAQP